MRAEFEFKSPTTLSECLELMAQGPGVSPIAGGTNLVVDLRSGRVRPRSVINVWELPGLSYIRRDDGYVAIGGRTTVTELLKGPLLGQAGRSILESAEIFGSPLIRNRATVAGNLTDASPAADLAPPLLALDAEVVLTSNNDTRRVPLDQFFLGPRQTVRRPSELLTEIRYPFPGQGATDRFLKLGLRWDDAIAVVSVATYLELEGKLCKAARVALGAVAPTPIRARKAEATLVGETLNENVVRRAATVAANEDAKPISDVRGSAEYRRWMVEVMVRRALMTY